MSGMNAPAINPNMARNGMGGMGMGGMGNGMGMGGMGMGGMGMFPMMGMMGGGGMGGMGGGGMNGMNGGMGNGMGGGGGGGMGFNNQGGNMVRSLRTWNLTMIDHAARRRRWLAGHPQRAERPSGDARTGSKRRTEQPRRRGRSETRSRRGSVLHTGQRARQAVLVGQPCKGSLVLNPAGCAPLMFEAWRLACGVSDVASKMRMARVACITCMTRALGVHRRCVVVRLTDGALSFEVSTAEPTSG